jgi:signal transduction histidine kinase
MADTHTGRAVSADFERAAGIFAIGKEERAAQGLPAAVTMVERRLRGLARPAPLVRVLAGAISLTELRLDDRDFGEVLRHELNNPLTGILGNAELLLLEARRGKLDLPLQTRQRLEIIVELAVRMRETVRHLGDRWETAGAIGSGEKETEGEPPHWPGRRW